MQRRRLAAGVTIILLLLIASCGGDGGNSVVVVDGRIEIPHGAVALLDEFEFTTELDVAAADGDYGLTFEGAFEAPDRLRGMLQLTGRFEEFSQAVGRPSDTEIIVIENAVWWRDGDEWLPGIEEGYERIDPLVDFRSYATPWFYLDALFFDTLSLPASDKSEEINGIDSVHVHLDKRGVIDVLEQALDIYLYPENPDEEPRTTKGVSATLGERLPDDFNIDVWFAEDGLYPTRILFDYTITEEDFSDLAFVGEVPLTLRMQMDITDRNVDVEIERPSSAPTVTPPSSLPTPEPGRPGIIPSLTAEDEARIQEIAFKSGYVQELLAVAGAYEIAGPFFVWHSSKMEKLGGGFYLEFQELATYENDWPQAVYDESEQTSPPFTTTTVRYRVEALTRVSVLVYLPGEIVVEIQPAGGTILPP